MDKAYRIIVIGGSWHGSDCLGLARGFREIGHSVELIGLDEHFPHTDKSIYSRIINRTMRPFYIQQFNRYIARALGIIKPDIVIAFKGSWVQMETFENIKSSGAWLCNFYPDVSFMCHKGVNINAFKYYDHIFTTKTFGIKDFEEHLGIKNVSFLPHGYDPAVHRPLHLNSKDQQAIDISFIGTWSPHKEKLLTALASSLPGYSLRIWGNQWEKSSSPNLKNAIAGHETTGDFYALAIAKSKINLGLLSEKRAGASMGDQITSRTFHIPACEGFLLHERTDEVLEYFAEDQEIACFSSTKELADKVDYYLKNTEKRHQVAKAGYERCIKENSLAERARVIIDHYENND